MTDEKLEKAMDLKDSMKALKTSEELLAHHILK